MIPQNYNRSTIVAMEHNASGINVSKKMKGIESIQFGFSRHFDRCKNVRVTVKPFHFFIALIFLLAVVASRELHSEQKKKENNFFRRNFN